MSYSPSPYGGPISPSKHTFIGDIYAGAVHGDFDRHLGAAGHVTQIIFGFIPLVGTLCAVRDFVADRRMGDHLGAVLNFLSFVPILGGFPKTAAVLHNLRHVGGVVRAVGHIRHNQQEQSDSAMR